MGLEIFPVTKAAILRERVEGVAGKAVLRNGESEYPFEGSFAHQFSGVIHNCLREMLALIGLQILDAELP